MIARQDLFLDLLVNTPEKNRTNLGLGQRERGEGGESDRERDRKRGE